MMQIIDPKLDPKDFCFWLQGFCELHKEPPTPEQWAVIMEHLELVFVKVTKQALTISTKSNETDWLQLSGTDNHPTVIC